MEYDKIYFVRERNKEMTVQELQGKSFCGSKKAEITSLLNKLFLDEYVLVIAAVPKYMVKGGQNDS